MIVSIPEQFGYKTEIQDVLEDYQREKLHCYQASGCRRVLLRSFRKEGLCFSVDYNGTDYHFQSSYYIGIDWLVRNELAIYVYPKLNEANRQIDFNRMLFEALSDPDNLNHLSGLVTIDFNAPHIPIKQSQDMLSPFLIIQYLQVLRAIVRKGLKRSYYTVTENLKSKVKGKILVPRTVKENVMKGKQTRTVCCYQEFGWNGEENRILKKAYLFAVRVLQQFNGLDSDSLQSLINYIHPAFENISDDIEISRIKDFKPNPLYKEYEQAIRLALLILKRYSYNINQTEDEQITTPPFWIDMSCLFELYVYKKLRDVFLTRDEVIYHFTTNSQELDYLINSTNESGNELKFVVDAKYKTYGEEDRSIDTADIRQLSGYARLRSVYDKLGLQDRIHESIKCLIIYPNQSNDVKDSFSKADIQDAIPYSAYTDFYTVAIRLPEISVRNGVS